MTPRRLGIDVGGTKCLAVVVDDAGDVLAAARRPTPHGEAALIDTLVAVIHDLSDHGSPLTLSEIAAVGLGVPGLIGDGIIHASPHLPGVIEFAVGAALSARLHVPVVVDNDATCAALAEWQLGAGRGPNGPVGDMVMVTMGTGIGGGIISGGRLQRGAHGFAGEFGHMMVDPAGPPCPCGRRGCWERYTSGSGLARLASDAATAGRLRLAESLTRQIRGEDVVRWAEGGDVQASAVLDEFAWWVGVGLATLANTLDPERFVLGGGLVTAADLFLDRVRAALRSCLYAGEHRVIPDVVAAELGERAGAIGAALLPAR
ncbi:MAG TPA: ROK family protein [Ilumatobacteraceae bacterium]|nr:ROK family protein [Ilumatobacteraceae bacterium]